MTVTAHLIRAWTQLAPKLVAFLSTGLTASGLIAALQLVGIHISAELATIVVGGIASVAAYIQRDRLLELAPGQLSLKVLAFIVTSASATTVVAIASELGADLTAHAPLIGAALTVIAALAGYFKADSPGSGALPDATPRPLPL